MLLRNNLKPGNSYPIKKLNWKSGENVLTSAAHEDYIEKSRQRAYISYRYKALNASQKFVDTRFTNVLPDETDAGTSFENNSISKYS